MTDPMIYFAQRPASSCLTESRANGLLRLWKWILPQRRWRPSTDCLSRHLLRDIGVDERERLYRRHR